MESSPRWALNVRRQREVRQLTQEKLAEFAGLAPTSISGIERGLRNPESKTSPSWLCVGVQLTRNRTVR